MASVNKVIILGTLGRDPEVRHSQGGKAVCNLSVATSSRRKDKNTGETIEDTQWHRVTLYERMAELAGEYLKKGSQVYFEGRLRYGKYTDKDGVERNTTDIIATEMQFLGGRQERQEAQRPAEKPAQRPASKQASGGGGFDDMDDDIPF